MTTPNPTDAKAVLFRAIVEYGHIRERAPEDSVTRDRLAGAVNESIVDLESAIRTERDTAWRAAIEGMRMEHTHGCNEARREYLRDAWADEDAFECVCRAAVWNAALSALADRMGAE